MAGLARWDRATAGRVDQFVANSRYVAGRIRRYYNRGSTVVYPPVDTAFYRPADDQPAPRSGFLVVSALVPYKRLEIAIGACRALGAPLSIVGTGPERARLQATAGPDVQFLGWRSDDEIRELYRRSEATAPAGCRGFRDGTGRGSGVRVSRRRARGRRRVRDRARRRDRDTRPRPRQRCVRRRALARARSRCRRRSPAPARERVLARAISRRLLRRRQRSSAPSAHEPGRFELSGRARPDAGIRP